MTRHLNSSIFDCLSFTESLITFLVTTDGEAPESKRSFTTSDLAYTAAVWSGVSP